MSAAPRSIGVLICTYRRPESLGRCLAALAAQERRPDEVIVVVRDSDAATHDWLASCKPDGLRLRVVGVTLPGTVAALNTGLEFVPDGHPGDHRRRHRAEAGLARPHPGAFHSRPAARRPGRARPLP